MHAVLPRHLRLLLLLLLGPVLLAAQSSSVPVGAAARHRIFSAAAGDTVASIVALVGTDTTTAEIFGTIAYGSVTTAPATLSWDLRSGQIDCANQAGAVTLKGPLLVAEGQQVFTHCPSGSILFDDNTAVRELSPTLWGAKGDNVTLDTAAIQAAFDAAYGTAAAPHARTHSYWNRKVVFPPGRFVVTGNPALTLTKVQGAYITGAGRFTTTIRNATSGGTLIKTNGMEYSWVGDLQLNGSGAAVLFDLDWDNSSGAALQSNTFSNVEFNAGAYGLRIGFTGFMGSETLILNSFFNGLTVAGLWTGNFNALANTVMGGNFQSCADGVHVYKGQVSIYGTGFQSQSSYDIVVENSSNDTMEINGVRSESTNFASFGNVISAHVTGVSHLGSVNGDFATGSCYCTFENIVTLKGKITNGGASVTVRNSVFGRTDWLASNTTGTNIAHILENVVVTPGGGPNSAAVSALASEQGNYVIGGGNLILAGRNSYDWYTTNLVDRWLRGARGAFFQFDTPVLSTQNPNTATGYLVEGINQHPQVRNPRGYQHFMMRARKALPLTGNVTIVLPAKTRVKAIILNVETVATGGTLNVGDSASGTRYFSAQGLTALGVVTSAVIEYPYAAGDTITATVTGVTGALAGYLAVDYVVENDAP